MSHAEALANETGECRAGTKGEMDSKEVVDLRATGGKERAKHRCRLSLGWMLAIEHFRPLSTKL